jgi:hypothetical protein
MKPIPFIFLLIILSISVSGLNNIYEFDEKSDIIITTSVYKNGVPNNESTCNLTIFNPPPNENFINLSVLLNNKGNGIYSYDLTGLLDYNHEIYPLTLTCNDSTNFTGYDERVGIKIGVRMYDFIIPGAILIAIAFFFIIISFKIEDKENNVLKLLFFFVGLAFVVISLFYGLAVVDQIPVNDSFKLIFITTITLFILLIILIIWLQFVDKLESAVNVLLGSK